MNRSPMLLVLAKAPVPGQVKTRLCPPLSPEAAADVAAAALLDTLGAVTSAAAFLGSSRPVVAWCGALIAAQRRTELAAALQECRVIDQRGTTLGERLAHAHLDCARLYPSAATLQIGMDSPQADADVLARAAEVLGTADAALGLAADGGWWALGLQEPRDALVLRGIPTSRSDTGQRTMTALAALGHTVAPLPVLRDVDSWSDAVAVAQQSSGAHFAASVRGAGPVAWTPT